MAGELGLPIRRIKDVHGHSWRIGTDAEVAWIAAGTSPGQRWWLGYLSTSADDLAFPGVTMAALPQVSLYSGQSYVLARPVRPGEDATPPGHRAF